MSKTLTFGVVILWLSSSLLRADHIAIGEERILPLEYPKSSITTNYNLKRNFAPFADSKHRFDLKNHFDVALSFEAGLLSYFNAGAIFDFSIPWGNVDIFVSRLSLFAKPYWAMTEQVFPLGRLGAGLSTSFGHHGKLLPQERSKELHIALGEVEHGSTFGGNLLATLGVEYFPWSRVGFALEGGIRAEIFRAHAGEKNNDENTTEAKALNYLVYEFPVGFTLHIIL